MGIQEILWTNLTAIFAAIGATVAILTYFRTGNDRRENRIKQETRVVQRVDYIESELREIKDTLRSISKHNQDRESQLSTISELISELVRQDKQDG